LVYPAKEGVKVMLEPPQNEKLPKPELLPMSEPMAESRNPKRKRRKRPITFVMYVTFWTLILVGFAGFFVSQAREYNLLRAERTQLQYYIDREVARIESLELQKTFFDSDLYVERLARDTLGMVRPDEIVFTNVAD
jgi:cell division protein FtsB